MIHRICLVALVCFFTTSGYAQKGLQFPILNGKTLEESAISIPSNNGKYSVIAIAFNRQAEDDLKKWLNPLFDAFIKDEKTSNNKGLDLADVYDVNFMFVPVIAGFKRISDDFKKDTDKRFWKYVMDTEKTDMKGLQGKLNIDDNKIPYFFILDPNGKVVELQNGKFSKAKLDLLEAAID